MERNDLPNAVLWLMHEYEHLPGLVEDAGLSQMAEMFV